MANYESLPVFIPTLDLVVAARDAIQQAWEDGREKYPGDPWREKQAWEHLRHIADHLSAVIRGDESEPHIEHMIFRLCALRANLLRQAK